MNHVQDVLGGVAVFAAVVSLAWMVMFGVPGAILASARGGSAPVGLVLGAFLGPIGWAIVVWTTRERAPAPRPASPGPTSRPSPTAGPGHQPTAPPGTDRGSSLPKLPGSS